MAHLSIALTNHIYCDVDIILDDLTAASFVYLEVYFICYYLSCEFLSKVVPALPGIGLFLCFLGVTTVRGLDTSEIEGKFFRDVSVFGIFPLRRRQSPL